MKAQPQQPVEPTVALRTFSVLRIAQCGFVVTAMAGSVAFAQPSTKAPAKKKPVTAQKKSSTTPEQRPVKGLPEMDITKELITEKAFETLDLNLNGAKVPGKAAVNYNRVLAAGVLNQTTQKVIEDWARWRIHGMTLKSKRANQAKPNELSEMRRDLLSDIRLSARTLLRGNRAAAEAFRTVVCREVTKRCAELMDNNYYVRLQAILILSNMNLMDYDPVNRTPPVAYGPAADVLMDLVIKKPQHTSLKIVAVNGLKRIATLGKFNVDLNRKMAAVLISEFERRGIHPWYQQRLARTLGTIDLPADPKGDAIIVQALMQAVAEDARPLMVRTESAKAVGRAAMPNTVNAELIAYEFALLARNLAQSYNADVQIFNTETKKFNILKRRLEKAKKVVNNKDAPIMPPHWFTSSYNLFLAFYSEDDVEEKLMALRRLPFDKQVGLLKKFPRNTAIKSSHAQILPIVSHMLRQVVAKNPAPVPAANIENLSKWLADTTNQPKSLSVQPGRTAPIREMKAAGTKPAGSTNTSATGP